jgi:GNAT superfamily N-acetyltransferase
VNDLNVLPDFRNQGIGNALLDAIESTARDRSEVVGLGVGLYRDYGAAQKIYVRRGYLPDGQGVMYANRWPMWAVSMLTCSVSMQAESAFDAPT